MIEVLSPARGDFRPLGCGWFIREKRHISADSSEKLSEKYTAPSPYKAQGCRYHSFMVYFSNLRRVGCAEEFGRKEPSTFQSHYPKGLPRRYYRLTPMGRTVSETAWANPYFALYG